MQEFLLNFILNIMKLIMMVPLVLFALFQPNDRPSDYFFPSREFFHRIENNCFFILLIRICAYPDQIPPQEPKLLMIPNNVPHKSSSPCSSGNKESPVSLLNPSMINAEGFKIHLINLPSDSSPKTNLGSNNSCTYIYDLIKF